MARSPHLDYLLQWSYGQLVQSSTALFAPLLSAVGSEPLTEVGLLSLQDIGGRTAMAYRRLLEPGNRDWSPLPAWESDRGALARFHGWHDNGHCLGSRGHEWLWILERQATEGFAHYLSSGRRADRLARSLAFLQSLVPPIGSSWPDTIDDVQVMAEKPAGGRGRRKSVGRIDLLVVARAEGKTVGAVIEAKFGHDLKNNPLPAYYTAAAGLGLTEVNCSFVVLAVEKDKTIRRRLARNGRWRFQSWRRLIVNFERLLPSEFDDPDFRRFRRTVFERAC